MIEEFVNENNEIMIGEEDWRQLNATFSQRKIIDSISDCIDRLNLPLPLLNISLEDALADFHSLRAFNSRKLWRSGIVSSKHSYPKVSEQYIEVARSGSLSSNHFHQLSRYKCASVTAPSPWDAWYDSKLRKNWLSALWTLKFDKVNPAVLRQALALRNYTAPQFRPSAAKAIYDLLKSQDVLDFSAGWAIGYLVSAHANKRGHMLAAIPISS
jgi:hypothetical protein